MGQDEKLKSENCGWYKSGNRFFPVLTDKEAASDALLEIIRCNCITGCISKHCTCKNHGLQCSAGFGHCRVICSNVIVVGEEDLDVKSDVSPDAT